jgi:D-3-phosphoglycerate dehydrogenase
VQVAEQISDYLLAGTVTNPINMPAVSAQEAPQLKPYITLARQLGSFVGQVTEDALKSVSIRYEGQAAGLNISPLKSALLTGLLSPLLEGVNMINAPLLAEERGIEIHEHMNEDTVDYQTRIYLEVTTEKKSQSIAGTLVGGDKQRIIQIDDINVEAELSGYMLFIRSVDKPGMIGAFGKILSDGNINIATFTLGRNAPGGEAITLISVDEPIGEPALMTICALPNVILAKVLKF